MGRHDHDDGRDRRFGGIRRVRLADVSRNPRAFWFYTTRNGKEEYAEQWHIFKLVAPTMHALVFFDLEVVNQMTGEKRFWKGRSPVRPPSRLPPLV